MPTLQVRDFPQELYDELRERFADLAERWNGPVPSCEDIAQMVHDGREERADCIMTNVEGYLATERQG